MDPCVGREIQDCDSVVPSDRQFAISVFDKAATHARIYPEIRSPAHALYRDLHNSRS